VICQSRKVRKTIHALGGTMRENLPVTEVHWVEEDRGQRRYLHDDLRVIKLQAALIWPAVMARPAAPTDVQELLLKPIRAGMQSPSHPRPSSKQQD
jgi:hypothetical protein